MHSCVKGDDVGSLLLHPPCEVSRCRTKLENSFSCQIDVAEVVAFAPVEVPCSWHCGAVCHRKFVVPVAHRRIDLAEPCSQGGLALGSELAQFTRGIFSRPHLRQFVPGNHVDFSPVMIWQGVPTEREEVEFSQLLGRLLGDRWRSGDSGA